MFAAYPPTRAAWLSYFRQARGGDPLLVCAAIQGPPPPSRYSQPSELSQHFSGRCKGDNGRAATLQPGEAEAAALPGLRRFGQKGCFQRGRRGELLRDPARERTSCISSHHHHHHHHQCSSTATWNSLAFNVWLLAYLCGRSSFLHPI